MSAVARDFDAERAERPERKTRDERTFKFCGEVFVVRDRVRPWALAHLDDIKPGASALDYLNVLSATVSEYLEGDDAPERWNAAVVERRDDPVTLDDLVELVNWMVVLVTDRPTSAPLPSGDGREPTDTTSTASSSSVEPQAA